MKAIRKADSLVEAFKDDIPAQWEHTLDLVRDLIQESSGGLIHHD